MLVVFMHRCNLNIVKISYDTCEEIFCLHFRANWCMQTMAKKKISNYCQQKEFLVATRLSLWDMGESFQDKW